MINRNFNTCIKCLKRYYYHYSDLYNGNYCNKCYDEKNRNKEIKDIKIYDDNFYFDKKYITFDKIFKKIMIFIFIILSLFIIFFIIKSFFY